MLRARKGGVRREMREATKLLLVSRNRRECAVGTDMHDLIDKASPRGTGVIASQVTKPADIRIKDPAELGALRVRIESPAFEKMFLPYAHQ